MVNYPHTGQRERVREHPTSLDGEPGEHLHWTSPLPDILIVSRDFTMYMLMVQTDDPELLERTRESFAFVD